jgi:hypothetical protein
MCERAIAGFLVSVRLSGSRQNRCRLTEEAYQSLDVLSYCRIRSTPSVGNFCVDPFNGGILKSD